MKNAEIFRYQYFLKNYFNYKDLIVDGILGPQTIEIIKNFKKNQGLRDNEILISDSFKQIIDNKEKQLLEKKEDLFKYNEATVIKTKNELPRAKYVSKIYPKKQIFLHFTAGDSGVGKNFDIITDFWSKASYIVSAHYIIDRDGKICEVVPPFFSTWHLGIKYNSNMCIIDKLSISIEIVAWGPLKKINNEYYNYIENFTKYRVDKQRVYTLEKEHRGFIYYDGFTNEQIISLEKLLRDLMKQFNIKTKPLTFFEYNEKIITDVPEGIFSHTNVNKGKYDIYPDKRIIEITERLSNENK